MQLCVCVKCSCLDDYMADGYCDEENNNDDCNYDGSKISLIWWMLGFSSNFSKGDCCLDAIKDDYCSDCICHATGVKHPTLVTSTSGTTWSGSTTWGSGTTGGDVTAPGGGNPGDTTPTKQDNIAPEETTKSTATTTTTTTTECDYCNSSILKTPCMLLILVLSVCA